MEQGKEFEQQYRGNSMYRVFRPGDSVLSVPVPFRSIRVGDIICFWKTDDPHWIVHRVIARSERELITQGDNNASRDTSPVTPEFMPRLVSGLRRGGKLLPVRNGKRGMAEFRFHRLCFLLLNTGRKLWPLFRYPFLLFRPKLRRVCQEEREVLYAGSRPVAERAPGEKSWHMLPDCWKSFYSSRDLALLYPPGKEACDEKE